MTDNTLRTAIADKLREVLDGQEAMHCSRVWEGWSVGTMSEDDFSLVTEDEGAFGEIVDAVLAVLAVPPDDVIERATEALRQDSYAVACPPWDSLTEEQKTGWLARGRLTLRAAFGGEQDG